MYFNGLFKKKISIEQGERMLTEYCKINGFDDNSTHWKAPSYAKHWFAYQRRSDKMIAKNWISYHPTRGNCKYSVWIDLVSEEIREILRESA